MAIQTNQNINATSDAAGNRATLSYTYDDVSLLVQTIIITNASPTMSAFASGTAFTLDANGNQVLGKNYQTTVSAAQSPQTITIPKGQANQLQLRVDIGHPNRFDGIAWEFRLE
jgi:hypothetical protein